MIYLVESATVQLGEVLHLFQQSWIALVVPLLQLNSLLHLF